MPVQFSIIIPARYASTRLPGKPLLDIHGKPLIQHVYEKACAAKASHVYIATDDERIIRVAESFGANAVMTSNRHESGADRLAEVVRIKNIPDDEIIVNVQADEYGLPEELILQVATGLHKQTMANVATLCEPIVCEKDYLDKNIVKVVFSQNRFALYFSRSPIPASRSCSLPGPIYRHIGLYAYRAGYLSDFTGWPPSELEKNEALEQLRILEHGGLIYVEIAATEPGMGIDTAADLEQARSVKK